MTDWQSIEYDIISANKKITGVTKELGQIHHEFNVMKNRICELELLFDLSQKTVEAVKERAKKAEAELDKALTRLAEYEKGEGL